MALENLQEDLFKSIDTIVQARIANLPYDKTIEGEIVDINNSNFGKYTVRYQAATFEASSTIIGLEVGDIVYVSIPQNDFKQEKIITAKKSKVDIQNVKKMPFLSFIRSNNLFSFFDSGKEYYILTNNTDNANPSFHFDTFDGKSEIAGYTKLGFRMTVNAGIETDLISGDYGVKITIYGYDTRTSKSNYSDMISVIDSAMISKVSSSIYQKDFYLKTRDMISTNPYNTKGYQNQEKVFDISGWVIRYIVISLWQDNNFKDKYNVNINDKKIFMSNLQLYFGYDISEFKKNNTRLFIYTKDGLLYNSDSFNKEIQARLITMLDDNTFEDSAYMFNRLEGNTTSRYEWEAYSSLNTRTSIYSNKIGFANNYLPTGSSPYVIENSNHTLNVGLQAPIDYRTQTIQSGFLLVYQDTENLDKYNFISNELWFCYENYQELVYKMNNSLQEDSVENAILIIQEEAESAIRTLDPEDFNSLVEYQQAIQKIEEDAKEKIEKLRIQATKTTMQGTLVISGDELVFKTQDGVTVLKLNTQDSQLLGSATTAYNYAQNGLIAQNLKAIENAIRALGGNYTMI